MSTVWDVLKADGMAELRKRQADAMGRGRNGPLVEEDSIEDKEQQQSTDRREAIERSEITPGLPTLVPASTTSRQASPLRGVGLPPSGQPPKESEVPPRRKFLRSLVGA